MASDESKRIRAGFFKTETVDTPIEILRQEWEVAAAQAVLPSNTTIESLTIAGIPCEKVSCGLTNLQKLMLFLHGGGFNSGSCKTHRELAAWLSRASGIPVLLIDYRLAPEYPFPAAIEDVAKVYRWLIGNGFHASNLIFSGDSAGGGLAISSLLHLRDQGTTMPAAAVLISPWLDLSMSGETMTSHAEVDPLTSYNGLLNAARLYIGERNPCDVFISPIFADLHHLPPMLIQVGSDELLLSDSVTFAEKARSVGIDVQLEVWPDMWHVWHGWVASLPEAQLAIERIGEYISDKFRL